MGGLNNTKEAQRAKGVLQEKCYAYLVDNFHKFTDKVKVYVALEITKKGMTNRHEHAGEGLSSYIQIFAGLDEARIRGIRDIVRQGLSEG